MEKRLNCGVIIEQMTNRDYLMGLSNGKLAEFIFSKKEEICDAMKACCCNNCLECIKKWLEMKRELDVEKGQIRWDTCRGRSWLILYADKKSNWCMALDKDGNVEKLAVGVVCTWDVEENVNVDEFLERYRYLQTT